MKKAIIIIMLALAAQTVMAAPRAKKHSRRQHKVERTVERHDSVPCTIYDFTPHGVMRYYVDEVNYIHESCEKFKSTPEYEVDWLMQNWNEFNTTWGDVLSQDAAVWELFLKAGDKIREMNECKQKY